jgi:TonB family protein
VAMLVADAALGFTPGLLAIVAGLICTFPAWCGAQERQIEQQPTESNRRVLTRVLPSYPELARRMNVVGTVRVVAVVAQNGKVACTELVGGSPPLVIAAVDAISKWKWVPAPEETKETIEIKFKPEHQAAGPGTACHAGRVEQSVRPLSTHKRTWTARS